MPPQIFKPSVAFNSKQEALNIKIHVPLHLKNFPNKFLYKLLNFCIKIYRKRKTMAASTYKNQKSFWKFIHFFCVNIWNCCFFKLSILFIFFLCLSICLFVCSMSAMILYQSLIFVCQSVSFLPYLLITLLLCKVYPCSRKSRKKKNTGVPRMAKQLKILPKIVASQVVPVPGIHIFHCSHPPEWRGK